MAMAQEFRPPKVKQAHNKKPKGLKGYVKAQNAAAKALAQQPDSALPVETGPNTNSSSVGQALRTFVVIECKAPPVNYTEEVFKQALRYAKKRDAEFLALTNGSWKYCFWKRPSGKWTKVEDIPDYAEALSGRFSLIQAEPEVPHLRMPANAAADLLLFHVRSRNSIGCDTMPEMWPFLLRLEDFLLGEVQGSYPFHAPAGLVFREDWGPHWHEVGNPSGGKWPGQYRTFLIEDPTGNRFMLGISLLGGLKAVQHSFYGNNTSKSVLIGALSFDAQYHPGIQYAICQQSVKIDKGWELYHDGRITIGKGAASRARLLAFVGERAPSLIVDGKIFLGSLPDDELNWENSQGFIGRFAAYTWLRHEFKMQVRVGRNPKPKSGC